LPLRTVPLQIQEFTPVKERVNSNISEAWQNQQIAIEAWLQELETRYSSEQRACSIVDIPLCGGRSQ
jgi:hypothetical protein